MSPAVLATLAAFAISAGASLVLARLAAVRGWTDDPAQAAARKLQPRPVPAIGGAAILLGLAAAEAVSRCLGQPGDWTWRAGSALVLAFLLGLADDRRRGGLSPLALALGQGILAAILVGSGWRFALAGDAWGSLPSALFVIFALNAVNTFDNADGAATSLGALGLSVASPAAAAACLGFLPSNLWIRPRGSTRSDNAASGSAPGAYLGNSGSLLLGMLFVLHPEAAWILVLPALDLLRLSALRIRRGSRPWVGDRRHLAHRLQAAGLRPTAVVVLLLLAAAPSLLGLHGAIATAILFAGAILRTPDVP